MEYRRYLYNLLGLRRAGIPNEPNPIIERQVVSYRPALAGPSRLCAYAIN